MARGAFTLAALLAVFLQAFVIEPHVHTANPLSTAIAANSGSHDAQQHATLPHERISCLVCQALASGPVALLASNAALAEPPRLATVLTSRQLHVGPRARAHAWQSRAPPIRL
jgi:hypothetical protein